MNGHRPGSFVWAPPPAIARDMFDELGSARHKRPDKALHIVVVPRLMTALWRKHLGKMADLLITIPCSESSIWCNAQHEPVLLAICFPLVSFRPWTLRNTPLLLNAIRQLREVLPGSPSDAGYILRELCSRTRAISSVSEGVARSMLLSTPWRWFLC